MEFYLLAFFGGLGMLLSFAGLGYLISFLIFHNKKFDLGLQAVFGLVLYVIVGGYFDFFKLISKLYLLGFLFLGLLVISFVCVKNLQAILDTLKKILIAFKNDKKFGVLVVVVFLMILVRYASAVSFFDFHVADDYHGYMVFPAKMIQTGHLGNDPFSERRIVSSLGGSYLLNAAVLSFGSFKNLHLIDNGVGFLLLILLLFYYFKDTDVNKYAVLLIIFLATIIPNPSGNVTSFLLAAALVFAVFRLFFISKALSEYQQNIAISLIVAVLIILKTNLIVPSILFFCCFFWSIFRHKSRSNQIFGLSSSLLIFLLSIFPWSVSMFKSSHTLLYPFLGKGYYGTSYGNFAGHFMVFDVYSFLRLCSEFLSGLCLFIPFIALSYLTIKKENKNKELLICIIFSCLMGVAAIVYGVGGYSLYYYTFPFVLSTVLILLVSLLKSDESDRNSLCKLNIFGLLVTVFMIGIFLQKDLDLLVEVKKNISFDGGIKIGFANSDLITSEELEQYKKLQFSVPTQETILARLDRNFLFDFKRNTILIIDLPGGSSLPPGLPFKNGSEKMANYLLSVGIKYVAYSYTNEANFSKLANSGMIRTHINPWLKAETEHSFDFQDNLMELYQNRKVVYDDGKNFVLDLSIKK